MSKLTTIREDRSEGTSLQGSTPTPAGFEPNRVDTIIADVFSLISLMFLTVGKSRESPAIYGQIASMRVGRMLLELMTNSAANTDSSRRVWNLHRGVPAGLQGPYRPAS